MNSLAPEITESNQFRRDGEKSQSVGDISPCQVGVECVCSSAKGLAPNVSESGSGTGHRDFFSARDIARALKLHKKAIQRLAAREQWPVQRHGNHLEYQPPPPIARCVVAQPSTINHQPSTISQRSVTFADLAHSADAREKVLLREKAVQLVHVNLGLGKETALQLVCNQFATDHPLFDISPRSLRRWMDAYAAHGLDGLVEQKRGRVGAKPFVDDLESSHLLQLAADAAGHGNWKRNNVTRRTNIARAYQNLVANPTVTGPARLWLHGNHASKSYVPPSVRRAVIERVAPLTATLIQVGPRAAKLDGAFTECTYDASDVRAFTADDMTANAYVWTEWPNENGFILVRPQILAVMNIGTLAWVNFRAVINTRSLKDGSTAATSTYNKDDVWGTIGDTLDDLGLHVDADGQVDQIMVLEGGTWQSNVVIGQKTGLSDEDRFGGLRSLGVKVIHTRTPRGKIIEGAFNQLQYAADNCKGYAGRDQRMDMPEDVKRNCALVKAGHAHPRGLFLHFRDFVEHVKGVMNQLNNERSDGKVLRGRTPWEAWSEFCGQGEGERSSFKPIPASAKWLFRSAYRVSEVTRNGVRVSQGSGKFALHYTYSHPALEIERGRRVLVFWNDHDPDTDAVVYTVKNGKPDKLICVASRVAEIARFGATEQELSAEAARKKLSRQVALSQRAALAPYLPRHAARSSPPLEGSGVGSDSQPSTINHQLVQASAANDEKKRTAARVQHNLRNTPVTAEDAAAALTLAPSDGERAGVRGSSEMSADEISALFSSDDEPNSPAEQPF